MNQHDLIIKQTTLSTKPVVVSTHAPEPFLKFSECRDQVVDNPDDDDNYLKRCMRAATALVQRDSGWFLGTRNVLIRYRRFPISRSCPVLDLPLEVSPISSIVSVKYRNENGAQQTLTGHEVELHHRPAFLNLPPNAEWPDVKDGYIDTLLVECEAGLSPDGCTDDHYGDVIEIAKQACLMLVGHWYDFRETVLIGSISKSIEFGYETLVENLKTYRYLK